VGGGVAGLSAPSDLATGKFYLIWAEYQNGDHTQEHYVVAKGD
jgi:hypothetical protein